MPSLARLFNRLRAAGKNGRLVLVSLGEHLRTQLKDHAAYGQSLEIYGKPRKVSLQVGEAQLDGCLKVWVGGPLEWDARKPVTMRKASFKTLSMKASV